MSISRLSFHYFSANQQQIIRGIRYAAKNMLVNPADTYAKIFSEHQYPKTVVIVKPACISVYPYSPQLGQSPYWGWLKFNTRKNTYAQKSGSMLVMEDGPSKNIRLELWKDGVCTEFIECSSTGISGTDMDQFLRVYREYNKTGIPENSISKGQVTDFSQLQKALKIPFFLPDGWQDACQMIEESQLLIIAKEHSGK